MRVEILLLVFSLMAVTYLPRLIPLYLFNGKVNLFFARFLRFIPYTILGVMAFPGFYESIKGNAVFSAVCMTSAVVISYLTENVIAAVVGSVIVAVVLSYF